MTWRVCGLTAVVVLAVAVAGCGGADDASESPSNDESATTGAPTPTPSTSEPATTSIAGDDVAGPDLCTLFENLDVAGLLAEEPGATRGDGVRCVVEAAAPDSAAQITVGVREAGQAAFVQSRELLTFDSEPEGLGDEAFVSGPWVHVLAGDRYIDLEVIRNPFGDTPPPSEEELIAAMRTVLTNLGMD